MLLPQKRGGDLLCRAEFPLPCITAQNPPPVLEMLMGKMDVPGYFGKAVLGQFTTEFGSRITRCHHQNTFFNIR